MKITIVQPDVYWENVQANLNHLEEKLSDAPQTDLIILPEMFSTGFSMNAKKLAEPMGLTSFKWMQLLARKHQAVVIGSLMIKENNQFYNRAIWMKPDGMYGSYDKMHPFRMMDEHLYFTAGMKTASFELKDWKIRPLICYDLRFPEISRNSFNPDENKFTFDLLIYVGNWPTPRISAWNTLLQARAMENSCYVAATNRVGVDGNEVPFGGYSNVFDPRGRNLLEFSDQEFVQTIEINLKDLQAYRENFQTHLDW